MVIIWDSAVISAACYHHLFHCKWDESDDDFGKHCLSLFPLQGQRKQISPEISDSEKWCHCTCIHSPGFQLPKSTILDLGFSSKGWAHHTGSISSTWSPRRDPQAIHMDSWFLIWNTSPHPTLCFVSLLHKTFLRPHLPLSLTFLCPHTFSFLEFYSFLP